MTVRIGDILQTDLKGWVEVVAIDSNKGFYAENWTGLRTYYDKDGHSVNGDRVIVWEIGTKPIGQIIPSDGLIGGIKHRVEWHLAHGITYEVDGEDRWT